METDNSIGKWNEREADPFWTNDGRGDSWAFEKPVYEWKEDFAEGSAPVDPALEQDLYNVEHRIGPGVNFGKYSGIKVSCKGGPEKYTTLESFKEAGLHPTLLENIARMNYSSPTPVQKNAIPIIAAGYDLLACAQTGSGKTAAFLLPVLSKIIAKLARSGDVAPNRPGARRTKASPQALIIVPTRELGIQLFDESRRFTYQTRVRPLVIYGGADIRTQKEKLALGCDILIATPGRLADAMERGAVALDRVRHLVLDEADRILDLGFEEAIRDILWKSDLPRDESLHTMMFSATFPIRIQLLARDFMKEDYCRLQLGRVGGTTTDIVQKVLYVEEYNKQETLIELLLKQPPSRTLIFVATKRRADTLDDVLYNKKFPCISLHGDRSQKERELALEAFKIGKSPILIATSVAARGLDIKDVMHVINFDLSNEIDDYIHRIGRTARAGNCGLSTTFYNEEQNFQIAPQLTQLLLECQQEVPEFLAAFTNSKIEEEEDFIDPSDPAYDNIDLSSGVPMDRQPTFPSTQYPEYESTKPSPFPPSTQYPEYESIKPSPLPETPAQPQTWGPQSTENVSGLSVHQWDPKKEAAALGWDQ